MPIGNQQVTSPTGTIPTTTRITDSKGDLTPSYQAWMATLKPMGVSLPYFGSGPIQYAGPNGFTGNVGFQFGTNLPNPTGVPGPCLFLGSGGGNGKPVTFCIIQDQAFDNVTPGNNLIITSGETQPSGSAPGGLLWLIGGASFGGRGGSLMLQAGTSLHGPGGSAILQGGNSTSGIAGDAFVIGGENGVQGGNVHLVMTTLNGLSGVVRIRNNSDILFDFFHDGSIYIYKGGGFGTAGQKITSQGAGLPVKWA